MNVQASNIMSVLPTVNKTDLEMIRRAAEMLLSTTTDLKTEYLDVDEELLFKAVKSELAAIGITNNVYFGMFAQTKSFKSWRKGFPQIVNFTKHFKKHIKTDIQKLGLFRIFIRTIIADLNDKEVSISLGTIANNLQRIEQTFDNSFPGYLKAGLGYLIITALINKKS